LPLVRFENLAAEKDRQLARALTWGALVPLVIVDLVPGSIPRYAMPALVPAIWLFAMTLSADNVKWARWTGIWVGGWIVAGAAVGLIQYEQEHPNKLGIGGLSLGVTIGVGLAVALGIWCWRRLAGREFSLRGRRNAFISIVTLACVLMWTYAVAIVPKMDRRQRIKRLAAQIEAAIPQSETVYALDPNYQPIFFYMRSKLRYVDEIDEVPNDARYLLVRPEREQEVLESNRWTPRRPHRIMRSTDYRKESILLLKIE